MGAKTLGGLETSGTYTYIFEEYSLRLCLPGFFPDKIILHFYRVSVLLIFFSGVIVFDTKNSWLYIWFWGIFLLCIDGHYRNFNHTV